MSTKLDISILMGLPELNKTVILEIEPLAPLSMVSELPGSYYKTLKVPDKKMLCGLFENLLGWHIDLADRKAIVKELIALRRKQAKKDPIIEFVDMTKGSTYCPLLMDYFEIQEVQPVFTKVLFYDDLWKKAYRRSDSADIHMGGSSNLDFNIIAKIHDLNEKIADLSDKIKKEKEKLIKEELEKKAKSTKEEKEAFFKKNLGLFPLFYSTPIKREFIDLKGKYLIKLDMDTKLYEIIKDKSNTNNLCYLGNNEGWINVNILES